MRVNKKKEQVAFSVSCASSSLGNNFGQMVIHD